MIKITNEVEDKLYELVPKRGDCYGCAFNGDNKCLLAEEHSYYYGYLICVKGIWKEVKDNEKTT